MVLLKMNIVFKTIIYFIVGYVSVAVLLCLLGMIVD